MNSTSGTDVEAFDWKVRSDNVDRHSAAIFLMLVGIPFVSVVAMLLSSPAVARADDETGPASSLLATAEADLTSADTLISEAYTKSLTFSDVPGSPAEYSSFLSEQGSSQLGELSYVESVASGLTSADETSPAVLSALDYLDFNLAYENSNDGSLMYQVDQDQAIEVSLYAFDANVNDGAITSANVTLQSGLELTNLLSPFGF